MILESIEASVLVIPFKTAFKHAAAERSVTQTLWVTARTKNGDTGFGEGCPREYVSGENLQSAQAFVATCLHKGLKSVDSIEALMEWVTVHRIDIDANPAAWTAIELALLDLLAKEEECSVEGLLELPELSGSFHYTAVLGDAPPRQFEAQLSRYVQAGFRDFKLKLSGNYDNDLAKIEALLAADVTAEAVRADANNLWKDAATAIDYLKNLNFPFFAIEEPLSPGDAKGMALIAETFNTNIILDESLLRQEQLAHFLESPDYWIINLRVSKMGGLLRSLALAQEARNKELRLIIGAHVGETSLLTRAALTIANSTRDILIAQEGAFGNHLLAHDVVEPPLVFGLGGLLNIEGYEIAEMPGFGLSITSPWEATKASTQYQ